MSSSSRIHIKSQAVAHSYNVSSGEAEVAWGGGGGVEELGVGDGLTSQPHLFGEIQSSERPCLSKPKQWVARGTAGKAVL